MVGPVEILAFLFLFRVKSHSPHIGRFFMETNLDKLVLTDPALESEGIDFEVGEVTFRLRRFGGKNPKMRAAQLKYFKPHAKSIELGSIDDSLGEEITVKAFIDSCLVKWEGLTDKSGQPIPCTPENAFQFFIKRLDLFNILIEYAKDHKNFLKEEYYVEATGN